MCMVIGEGCVLTASGEREPMRKLYISTLIVIGLLAYYAFSQTTGMPIDLARQLESPDPSERAKAFEALVRLPAVLQTSAGIQAIVKLLQRETALIESTLRDSNGKVGVSEKYGEGYGEYYSKVLGLLATIGNKNDPEVLDILARAVYEADSGFAVELAKTKGIQILPAIFDLCKKPLVGSRMQGIEMLGTIVHENKALSAAAKTQMKTAVSAALRDADGAVRQSATAVLGEIGDARDISDLEMVAKNDKGVLLESGERRYFLRDAAAKAIVKIRQRSTTR